MMSCSIEPCIPSVMPEIRSSEQTTNSLSPSSPRALVRRGVRLRVRARARVRVRARARARVRFGARVRDRV